MEQDRDRQVPVRGQVAGVEILKLHVVDESLSTEADSVTPSTTTIEVEFRALDRSCLVLSASHESSLEGLVSLLQALSNAPFRIAWHELQESNKEGTPAANSSSHRAEFLVQLGIESLSTKLRGAGRSKHKDRAMAECLAILRAMHHAGLLSAPWRANSQKVLRATASEITDEIREAWRLEALSQRQKEEAESILLQHLNRTSSAAVVTASNAPKQDRILQLFDSSAWLYDRDGRLRNECLDTDVWLAWYPGLDNPDALLSDVLATLPSTPDTKIPFIVKLFENPTGWLRFRGAIHLADHDILHVLLGRGLQDQDEAFVLGFAMGTAKRVPWWQRKLFRYILSRVYPEPFRISRFLLAAFDLGVEAGMKTGTPDLYRDDLGRWLELPLKDARREAGIDTDLLRSFYRREQLAIPQTIASVRLPN